MIKTTTLQRVIIIFYTISTLVSLASAAPQSKSQLQLQNITQAQAEQALNNALALLGLPAEQIFRDLKFLFIRVVPILFQFFMFYSSLHGEVEWYSRYAKDFMQTIFPATLLIFPSFVSPDTVNFHDPTLILVLRVFTIMSIAFATFTFTLSVYDFCSKTNDEFPNENSKSTNQNTSTNTCIKLWEQWTTIAELKALYRSKYGPYKCFMIFGAIIEFGFNVYFAYRVYWPARSAVANFPFFFYLFILSVTLFGYWYSFPRGITRQSIKSSLSLVRSASQVIVSGASVDDCIIPKKPLKQKNTFALGYTVRTMQFAAIIYYFSSSQVNEIITSAALVSASMTLSFAVSDCHKLDESIIFKLDHMRRSENDPIRYIDDKTAKKLLKQLIGGDSDYTMERQLDQLIEKMERKLLEHLIDGSEKNEKLTSLIDEKTHRKLKPLIDETKRKMLNHLIDDNANKEKKKKNKRNLNSQLLDKHDAQKLKRLIEETARNLLINSIDYSSDDTDGEKLKHLTDGALLKQLIDEITKKMLDRLIYETVRELIRNLIHVNSGKSAKQLEKLLGNDFNEKTAWLFDWAAQNLKHLIDGTTNDDSNDHIDDEVKKLIDGTSHDGSNNLIDDVVKKLIDEKKFIDEEKFIDDKKLLNEMVREILKQSISNEKKAGKLGPLINRTVKKMLFDHGGCIELKKLIDVTGRVLLQVLIKRKYIDIQRTEVHDIKRNCIDPEQTMLDEIIVYEH